MIQQIDSDKDNSGDSGWNRQLRFGQLRGKEGKTVATMLRLDDLRQCRWRLVVSGVKTPGRGMKDQPRERWLLKQISLLADLS